jgi:hypothetical protein
MKVPLEVVGLMIPLGVRDLAAGVSFSTRLLGRPPDSEPYQPYTGWEVLPNCWLRREVGPPETNAAALRPGVEDVASERERLRDALGITVSAVERVEGVAAWCDIIGLEPAASRWGSTQAVRRVWL